MKKLSIILFLSFSLIGCSSIELEAVSSSKEQTQRILNLGLSYEDNLIEAKKIKDSHISSVVIGQLKEAENAKKQANLDDFNSIKYAQMVKISDDNLNYIGASVSESVKKGVLIEDIDIQEYLIKGQKDLKSGLISHTLRVKLKHISENRRSYSTANLCDKWQGCDGEKLEINPIYINASGCTAYTCEYVEVIEISLSDNFLRENIDSGFTIKLNSKSDKNKITVSSAYLKGYLQVVKF
jgi:hypothetical protein